MCGVVERTTLIEAQRSFSQVVGINMGFAERTRNRWVRCEENIRNPGEMRG